MIDIIQSVKEAAKLAQEVGKIELYQKILDLQAAIMEISEENRNLKRELADLQQKFIIKSNLKFENDRYFLIEGDKKDGPFCSPCWDTKQLTVRLHDLHNGYLTCPNKDCHQTIDRIPRN